MTSPDTFMLTSLVGFCFPASIACPPVPVTDPDTVIDVSPVPECTVLIPAKPVISLVFTVIVEPSL